MSVEDQSSHEPLEGAKPQPDVTLGALDPIDVRLRALEGYFSSTLTDLSKFVETRASVFLIIFGALVICANLVLRLRIDGSPLAVLTSGEFIAVLVLGLALIVLGTGTTMFQLHSVVGVEEKKIEEGVRFAGAVEGRAVED